MSQGAAVGSVLAGNSRKGKTWRQSLPWRLTRARSDRIAEDMYFPGSAVDISSPVIGQAGNRGVIDFLEAEKV